MSVSVSRSVSMSMSVSLSVSVLMSVSVSVSVSLCLSVCKSIFLSPYLSLSFTHSLRLDVRKYVCVCSRSPFMAVSHSRTHERRRFSAAAARKNEVAAISEPRADRKNKRYADHRN